MNPRLDLAIVKVKVKELLRKYNIAIHELDGHVTEILPSAVEKLSKTSSKIIFLGVGKAGLVARKTAATFSSLGIPSFFIHPSDALHGDLGCIQNNDVCLIFSNSGETDEILNLLPILKTRTVFTISVTGRPHSSLAKFANINLPIGTVQEICHLDMAPTLSTTLMMIVGDILAVLTSENKKFTRDEYGQNHPLGSLGKNFLYVKEIMRETYPAVSPKDSIKNVLFCITKHRTGSALIVNEHRQLIGIFTDGDLRRHLHEIKNLEEAIETYMTKNPKTLSPNDQVIEAAHKFATIRCDEFPVVDESGSVVGLLDIQDLIKLGVDIKA